jgi:hypothetical protein
MTRLGRLGGALAALMLCLFATVAARADSWALPEVTVYEAPGKQFRLTVTPRALESQLSYFSEAVEKQEKPGQAEGGAEGPRGLFERRDASGQWAKLWEAPLVNDVAPVKAIVSDLGDYVATFDNWHSMGWGKDAVVIYDARGSLVRAMALVDFLPEDWFLTLPRSVSSIWWSGEHRFEGGKLILQIVMPDADTHGQSREYVELALDPATGKAEPRDAAKWRRGLDVAARAAVPIRTAQAEYLAMLRAPLLAPDGVTDKRTLHWYLAEAFHRLDPEWETASIDDQVLERPGAENYPDSRKWLRNALERKPIYGNALGIASHDPANLAEVLVAEAATVSPGPLRGARVYVTVGNADRDRVAAAIERLGAKFVQLDPAKPIPQRPERISANAAE